MAGESRDRRTSSGNSRAPWVIVAGGFQHRGGLDRANAALARHLAEDEHPVHLVGHTIDPELAAMPMVTIHRVPKPVPIDELLSHRLSELCRAPAGSFLLGERLLDRRGRRVAREVTESHPDARVLVNGANCIWPDINWVHAVHHAWRPSVAGAPLWFKAKRHAEAWRNARRQFTALKIARLVIANSDRTRRDLLELVGLAPERVHTVWMGCDLWREVTPQRRADARSWLRKPPGRPLVIFVGELGHDRNKGFDTLLHAWRRLCARPDWDADLIAAGGGRAVDSWRRKIERAGLGARITMLGFTDRIADLVAAADLLVSPVRYEAYGLNVHEALCCGVPAIVSACAGVADRYRLEMRDMLLPDPEDAADLAARLMRWRADMAGWKARVESLALELRERSWDDMADEIVALAERGSQESCSRTQTMDG